MQGKNISPALSAVRTEDIIWPFGVWAASFALWHPVCDVTFCALFEPDSSHGIPQIKEPALFQGFWKLLMVPCSGEGSWVGMCSALLGQPIHSNQNAAQNFSGSQGCCHLVCRHFILLIVYKESPEYSPGWAAGCSCQEFGDVLLYLEVSLQQPDWNSCWTRCRRWRR